MSARIERRCEKISHMETVSSWAEIGERVAEARQAAGFNQGELAERLDIDRTSVVRMEAGERKISALELFRLAEVLGVPTAHFVARPPAPLLSRRTALDEDSAETARSRFRLDAQLEAHARDAQWLVEHDFLKPMRDASDLRSDSKDQIDPIALATRARDVLGLPRGPLPGMADVAERFDLYVVSLPGDGDGASLLLDGYGVAVVGGDAAPGRRRWTAAHELGHHLLQDEYNSDLGVSASRDEREGQIDRFAEALLIPDADLAGIWSAAGESSTPRLTLIDTAITYRLSWSVVIRKALRLGLISVEQSRHLRADTPTRGDLLAVAGSEPQSDLAVGTTGTRWRKAALAAWQQGFVTGSRVVELLHGAIREDELPLRELEDPES